MATESVLNSLLHGLSGGISLTASWLATYWIHSALLIGAVWLATRRWGVRSPSARDGLWKLALVGGLATATVQVGFYRARPAERLAAAEWPGVGLQEAAGGSPGILGSLGDSGNNGNDGNNGSNGKNGKNGNHGTTEASSVTELHSLPTGTSPISPTSHSSQNSQYSHSSQNSHSSPPPHTSQASQVAQISHVPQASPVSPPSPSASSARLPYPGWIVAFWAIGAVVALGRYRVARRRFERGLGNPRDVPGSHLHEVLRRQCEAAGIRRPVRLFFSARIAGPVALPDWRICLPARALTELSADQLEGLLAHELAHLVRGDPAWLRVCGILESLFFFQPLNRLARRSMQESWEVLCDDWAVGRTGGGMALATCLAHVATWMRESSPDALHAPGMAQTPSHLVIRVERLLAGRRLRRSRIGRIGWLSLGGALVALVAVYAPSVVAENPVADLAARPAVEKAAAKSATITDPSPGTAAATSRGDKGVTRYRVVAGEFGDRKSANRLNNDLEKEGYFPVEVEEADGRFRVIGGPAFSNRADAEALANALIQEGGYRETKIIEEVDEPSADAPTPSDKALIRYQVVVQTLPDMESSILAKREVEGSGYAGRGLRIESREGVYAVLFGPPLPEEEDAEVLASRLREEGFPGAKVEKTVAPSSEDLSKADMEARNWAAKNRLMAAVGRASGSSAAKLPLAKGGIDVTDVAAHPIFPPSGGYRRALPEVRETLRPGDSLHLGEVHVRLIAVDAGNPFDPNDDSATLIVRTADSDEKITLCEFASERFGDDELFVEDVNVPVSPVEGHATMLIRSRPSTAAAPPPKSISKTLVPGETATLGDVTVRLLAIKTADEAETDYAVVDLLIREGSGEARAVTLERYRSALVGGVRLIAEDINAGPEEGDKPLFPSARLGLALQP